MTNHGLLIFDRPSNIIPQDHYERFHRIACGMLNMLTGQRLTVSQSPTGSHEFNSAQTAKTKVYAITAFFILGTIVIPKGALILGTVVVLSVAGLIAGQFSGSRAQMFKLLKKHNNIASPINMEVFLQVRSYESTETRRQALLSNLITQSDARGIRSFFLG